MHFRELAERMRAIEATTKRLEMARLLSETLQATTPDEVPVVGHLLLGTLAPEYEGVEVGLAEKTVHRLLQARTGASDDAIRTLAIASGDLGSAAEALWSRPRAGQVGLDTFTRVAAPPPPTVLEVHGALLALARIAGEGSQEVKHAHAQRLLDQASAIEARYIVRFLVGKLRLGVADMTLLDGAAIAFAPAGSVAVDEKDGLPRPPEDLREALERAYNLTSDIGLALSTARRDGLEGLRRITITPGRPVRPMLAERSTDPAEIMENAGSPALAEYKYDGLRIQAHLDGDACRLFSRRLEEVTTQFPDVVEIVRAAFRGRRVVVEGEAVPIDLDTGRFRPFQDISRRRGRRHGLAEALQHVPVALFVFDLLYLDGEDVTTRPLGHRRRLLAEMLRPSERLALSDAKEVAGVDELEAFFDDAVARGAEGVMVKALGPTGTYQAGARGWRWIKYKKDYVEALADSLDLVIVGAWHGKGRRAGWYGALLAAAWNPEAGRYESVCKVGTGFKDLDLEALNERLDRNKTPGHPPDVTSGLEPDVWFRPAIVAEVRGAELSRSPVHTCGATAEGGIALRFPRFLRWRDDKGAEQASTTAEVVEAFRRQRNPA